MQNGVPASDAGVKQNGPALCCRPHLALPVRVLARLHLLAAKHTRRAGQIFCSTAHVAVHTASGSARWRCWGVRAVAACLPSAHCLSLSTSFINLNCTHLRRLKLCHRSACCLLHVIQPPIILHPGAPQHPPAPRLKLGARRGQALARAAQVFRHKRILHCLSRAAGETEMEAGQLKTSRPPRFAHAEDMRGSTTGRADSAAYISRLAALLEAAWDALLNQTSLRIC